MYGWRGRIGLIVPSSNTTMEAEFWRMAPRGVSIHTARMKLSAVTVEELIRMEEEALRAAELLSTADVNIVVYGCTTGSLVKGPGHDEAIASRLKSHTGIDAVATSTAVLKALEALGASSIALATPYIDELNEKERSFLEAHGYRVVDLKALHLKNNTEIGRQYPETAYRLARTLNIKDADIVFISCTNFRTIDVIEALEADLGLPVFSSNTATMWYTLRKLGIKDKVKGYGSLFLH
jgi:maleate isomerase